MTTLIPVGEAPPLLIFPRPHVAGAATLDEGELLSKNGYQARQWPVVSPEVAFGPIADSDAHCVQYLALRGGAPLETMPRLTLGAMHRVQEWGVADSLVGGWVFADLDLPQTDPVWTDALMARYQAVFDKAAEQEEIFRAPTVFYTTRGGLRLAWALSKGCPLDGEGGIKDLVMGVIALGALLGLGFDVMCKDPTRLMRLPKVMRASNQIDPATGVEKEVVLATWQQPYFRMSWGRVDFSANEEIPAQILAWDADEMPHLSALSAKDLLEFDTSEARVLIKLWGEATFGRVPELGRGAGSGAPGQQPAQADLPELLGSSTFQWLEGIKGRVAKSKSPSRAYQAIAKALDSAKNLYQEPSTLKGLHGGIMSLVGAVIEAARADRRDITPQEVFAFVFNQAAKADALRPPSSQRNAEELGREVWSIIDYLWVTEEDQTKFRQEMEAAREAKRQQEALDMEGSIHRTMSQWLGQVEMEKAKHLTILDVSGIGKYVLARDEDGQFTYQGPASDETALVPYLRDCRLGYVEYKKTIVGQNGVEVRYAGAKELMDRYGTSGIRYKVSRLVEKSRLERDPLGITLAVKFPGMRTDLTPVYDEKVDRWLRLLGGDLQEKLLDWLASAFNIAKPTAGLIIHGDPSIGKGMLGLALQNCTQSRKYANFSQLMESFQTDMAKTPFIWADENTEGGYKGADKSLINNFKRIVTGEYNTLNLKHKDHMEVDGHWRLLVTGNNVDNILRLNEDVNDADIDAVVVRTLFITSNSAACKRYLESLGGREGTSGWPEQKIPQHIRWLAENRQVIPGKRLLVEGVRTSWHDAKRINTVATHDVLHLIAEILHMAEVRCPTGDPSKAVMDLDNSGIHIQQTKEGVIDPMIVVCPQKLRKAMVNYAANDRSIQIPPNKKINDSLLVFALQNHAKGEGHQLFRFRRVDKAGRPHDNRFRGIQVNLKMLLYELYNKSENFDFHKILGPALWNECKPKGAELDTDPEPPPAPLTKPTTSLFGRKSA